MLLLKKEIRLVPLSLLKDGKVILESPLVQIKDVKEAGWWTLYKRSFGMFTKSGK